MSNRKLIYILLPIACVICNISQLPQLWDNRAVSFVYQGVWMLVLGTALLSRGLSFKVPKGFMCICLAIAIFMGIATLISGNNYFSSTLWGSMLLCLFVLFTSLVAGMSGGTNALKTIVYAYVISATVDAVMIFSMYFSGVDWLNASGYIYTAKNSIAVIFLTAIVLIYYFMFKKLKTISIILMTLLSLFVFMLKSRATILSWCVFMIYILCIGAKGIIRKLIGVFVCALAVIAVLTIPVLREIVIDQTILNNRTADIGTLTSGRDVHYEIFADMFPKYAIIGTGGTYLESFPLAVLLSFGILGAIPIFLLSFYPALKAIRDKMKYREKNNTLLTVIFILCILLWVNGLFEELTPFGPGVKCYMLWMLTGLYIGDRIRQGEKNAKCT